MEMNKLVRTVEQQDNNTTDAEQLCRSWLAACGHQSSNVPVCHRWKKDERDSASSNLVYFYFIFTQNLRRISVADLPKSYTTFK